MIESPLIPVRLGIIGCGGMGRRHAMALSKQAGVQLVACADTDPARCQALAGEYGIPRQFGSADQMLRAGGLDAVSVCTSNSSHAAVTIMALEAGLHVLCEKPMARSAAEALGMVYAAERTGCLLTVGHYMRHLPQTIMLRNRIQRGELGSIRMVRCRGLRRQGIPGWGGFHRKAVAGGGPLLDTAVHTLDLVMDLLGWPRALTASGVALQHRAQKPGYQNHPAYGRLPAEPMDVEDLALGLIRLEGGVTIILEVSWAGLTPEDEDYAQVLVGDQAGARIRPFGPGALLETFHSVQGQSVDVAYEIPESADVYEPQMAHWVRCLRGQEQVRVRPEQATVVLSIIDALYASAAIGHEVSIEAVPVTASV